MPSSAELRADTDQPRTDSWGKTLDSNTLKRVGLDGGSSEKSTILKKFYRLALGLGLVLAPYSGCRAEKYKVDSALDRGGILPAYCFAPDLPASRLLPAMVVAASAGGHNLLQYHTYCKKLSNRDFIVLLVDAANFPERLAPGPDSWRRMPYYLWSWTIHILVAARLGFGHEWYVGNIRAALEYVKQLPRVDHDQVGLCGFSQSANASLCCADCPVMNLRFLVWNHGGWPWIMPYEPSRLPPVLIFHGEKDGVYSPKYARKLAEELKAAGRDVECYIYPDERHMFNVYYDLREPDDASRAALVSSFERLYAFLNRVTKKRGADSPAYNLDSSDSPSDGTGVGGSGLSSEPH